MSEGRLLPADYPRYLWERSGTRHMWERIGGRRPSINGESRIDEAGIDAIASWVSTWRAPALSICIPTRDRLDLLLPCLLSLVHTSPDAAVEVVLGDTGSRPETVETYRAMGLPVISVPGSFNFSRTCNTLAESARGEQLLFLNSDTEALSGDWVASLLSVDAQRIVGACLLYPGTHRIQSAGIEVVTPRPWPQRDVYRPFRARRDGLALRSVALGRRAESLPGAEAQVMAVSGAFLSLGRSLFQSLGGFDEGYRLDLQDVDLCLQARRGGIEVVCRHDLRFSHRHGGTRGRYTLPLDDWRRFVLRWSEELSGWTR